MNKKTIITALLTLVAIARGFLREIWKNESREKVKYSIHNRHFAKINQLCTANINQMRKAIYLYIIICAVAALTGCEEANYKKSLPEIDELADDYPAQARLFLDRADSTEEKAYYKLLATKIKVQQEFFSNPDYDDIDDCIRDYEALGDSEHLARALYYKATMKLMGERDTTEATALYHRVLAVSEGKPCKVVASTYDKLCRTGQAEDYTKLRQVSDAIGDTLLLARSYLYQALQEHDVCYADKAFRLAESSVDAKDIRTMHHDLVRFLIDSQAPDTIVMRYLSDVATWHSPVGFFTAARYLYNHPHPEFTKDYLSKYGTHAMELAGIKTYWFNSSTYALMANMYFAAERSGNKPLADSILREMKPMEYVFYESENNHNEKEVSLMYEGGNTRYRYMRTRAYIMYGVIAVLLVLLMLAVLYIRRIRRANRIIADLTESVHQLKDVDNPALSDRCDKLSHEIDNQLRRLKHREADIASYKQQVEQLEDVSQGLLIYSRIIKNENISQIGRNGISQFLASFRIIDKSYAAYLTDLDLNPSASLFCILYHLGKTDEEVMQIMQYTLANVRTRKSRIKADTGAASFDELITK